MFPKRPSATRKVFTAGDRSKGSFFFVGTFDGTFLFILRNFLIRLDIEASL
jgi:hypothetical protein